MSDDHAADGEQIAVRAVDPRVVVLAGELIEASGNYGLRVEKLENARALLGLPAVRERADRDGLSTAEAAQRHVREAVDAWPDQRGRLILRSALGFDHGTERGRQNRLDLLATQLNEGLEKKHQVSDSYLDHSFVTRLGPDLAAMLLGDERRPSRRRVPVTLRVGAVVLLLLVLLLIFLLLRNDGQADETSELVFAPVPERCSIDVCGSEQGAVEAQTGGFTPGGLVDVAIFAPSGENANDLGGMYAYRDQLRVDDDGSFTWLYWWDPGMEIGTYQVRVTDQATGQSVEADFEFFDDSS